MLHTLVLFVVIKMSCEEYLCFVICYLFEKRKIKHFVPSATLLQHISPYILKVIGFQTNPFYSSYFGKLVRFESRELKIITDKT